MRAASGIAASGPASLMGMAETTSILDAALVNGTAAHALDFDDCNNTMGGHPSAPIIPALWALGERENASGQAVLEAYLTGFEVETRIGRAVNFHHYEKG
jgi:2-methylcitrate dehydratase PrpD